MPKEQEPEIIDVEPERENDDAAPVSENKSVVLAGDLLPETLLIVPALNRPLFPKTMGPIVIAGDELKREVVETLQSSNPYLGLIMPRSAPDELSGGPAAARDFHEVGVAVRVVQAAPPHAEGPLQMVVQVLQRFNVLKFVSEAPVFRARVEYWHEAEFETNEELKAYSLSVVDGIKELVNLNPLYKEGLSLLIDQIDVHNPGALADFAAAMTTASGEELQEILAMRSVRRRIEQVLILLKREIEISKLKTQISQRIEERMSKQQREFFLNQQLKEIKEELGLSKGEAQTEVDAFQERIDTLTLTEEARERIDEEISKLKLIEPSSPEFNVIRGYLDWLTVLPWGVYTEDNYDLKDAAKVLDEDHYGLSDVKDRILELISVGIVKGNLAGSIMLLVGPPGVGKTSVGHSIARALGREFYRFSLGGIRDEAEIKGHRRTYIGAMPGKFIQAIKTCKTANPLIMLDEVDKIGASFHGDPASALLEVLDPEQNREFLDHYLDVRFDLSKVLFVCTANQIETIPRPLLDRMEVIQVSGYVLEEKLEIAHRHLIPKQLKAHGLSKKQVAISKRVLRAIIDGWAREAGVRGLENNIKKLLRKSAREIVQHGASSVKIDVDDLQGLLGRRLFTEEKAFRKPRVGVVRGLAYTALGGATLYVEAASIPAPNPGFKQTGQLGAVMVESSEIAYSYVRSIFRDDPEAKEFLSSNLIHLHVPAGATPKDGPSAGITMACAIYSLVTGQTPEVDLAMTGELTLSGVVMPIGGVKEKMIAARRAGVKTMILPEENRADCEDLDEHITRGITLRFVRSFDDVRKICFPKGSQRTGRQRRRSSRSRTESRA
ncbi:MAG: endopeptidase La [Deltaproteobacteria bacterium]|nr:endopeptidase La [Deltaproteobacteria bacterium]